MLSSNVKQGHIARGDMCKALPRMQQPAWQQGNPCILRSAACRERRSKQIAAARRRRLLSTSIPQGQHSLEGFPRTPKKRAKKSPDKNQQTLRGSTEAPATPGLTSLLSQITRQAAVHAETPGLAALIPAQEVALAVSSLLQIKHDSRQPCDELQQPAEAEQPEEAEQQGQAEPSMSGLTPATKLPFPQRVRKQPVRRSQVTTSSCSAHAMVGRRSRISWKLELPEA